MSQAKTKRGFSLSEGLVIVLVLAVAAAVAAPRLSGRSAASETARCIDNLAKLETSKEQWLSDNVNEKTPPLRSDLDGSYVVTWPVCASGGSYELNGIGATVTCSLGGDHKR